MAEEKRSYAVSTIRQQARQHVQRSLLMQELGARHVRRGYQQSFADGPVAIDGSGDDGQDSNDRGGGGDQRVRARRLGGRNRGGCGLAGRAPAHVLIISRMCAAYIEVSSRRDRVYLVVISGRGERLVKGGAGISGSSRLILWRRGGCHVWVQIRFIERRFGHERGRI